MPTRTGANVDIAAAVTARVVATGHETVAVSRDLDVPAPTALPEDQAVDQDEAAGSISAVNVVQAPVPANHWWGGHGHTQRTNTTGRGRESKIFLLVAVQGRVERESRKTKEKEPRRMMRLMMRQPNQQRKVGVKPTLPLADMVAGSRVVLPSLRT